jgi:hypothetical protein
VFHTHMPYASALTRLEDPRIKEIGQTEVGLIDAIAYDGQYTGPALDPREGERLAKIIGNKSVLFMANHAGPFRLQLFDELLVALLLWNDDAPRNGDAVCGGWLR